MMSRVWQKAVAESPDPPRAKQFVKELLAAKGTKALLHPAPEQARVLAWLFSGSQALSEQLLAQPAWVKDLFDLSSLQYPRREQGLRRDLEKWFKRELDREAYAVAWARLRMFKQQQMLRIAARDLARMSHTVEITEEISGVAEVCLDAAWQICWRQMANRHGLPYSLTADEIWEPTAFAILGLGKLGGRELNYSSDVDLMFVYSDEGCVFREPPRMPGAAGRGMSNHQFFQRLIESYVAEVTRLTAEGALFRVDLRLRPEGNAGPLARSLSSYENYYAQWGQTWERMMLIKARGIAGDRALAAEFLEMIQPFRFPRWLPEGILRETAEMKRRIENEVVGADEIERNVKLGRGGIREVEFVAQTLQLLHGGKNPFLQEAQTLPALRKLAQYRQLTPAQADELSAAYCFLRDVEHRLQMENNLQTHTIPTDRRARERLAVLMAFESLHQFESALSEHTGHVRATYESVLAFDVAEPELPLPADFVGQQAAWKTLLADHGFRRVDDSFGTVRTFIEGPGYVLVSRRTVDLAKRLFLKLVALCPRPARKGQNAPPPRVLSDPDRVLARLDTYISAYGARATLYETWVSNPSLFELVVLLFDRSEYLAETAIRIPDLVEELVESGQLRRRKGARQILEDLEHGRADEDQRLWLRRYHQAELMRLGLRDILGLADFEQNLEELTGLADACLTYALEVVMRKAGLKRPPFAIVGLGKLGGAELTYGSDLDLIFVTEAGAGDLAGLQTLAAEIMSLLSSTTELGVAFVTDARLRPDGDKGLLVNTLDAFEQYYRHRAMLWELQAISRTRPIAGDATVGAQFHELAGRLTNFSRPDLPLAAYQENWRHEIARMRDRIERERTPAGKGDLAIKTGRGGLMDAEFVAQTLCLAYGWQESNTLRALERGKAERVLGDADAGLLIENYRKLRRIEGILRRWSFVGETVLPDDPAPLHRVAVRCGFADAAAFLRAVGACRNSLRQVYEKVLGPAASV